MKCLLGSVLGFIWIQASVLWASDQDSWSKYVGSFRSQNSFGLSIGYTSGSWDLDRGGAGKISAETKGVVAKFQYMFSLGIWESFGYVLGSSAGISYETSSSDDFASQVGYQIPGFYFGLSYDVSPRFRLGIGAEGYLVRRDGIFFWDKQKYQLSSTFQTWIDSGFFMDYFYDLLWAIRFEYHRKTEDMVSPQSARNQLESLGVNKREQYFSFGMVRHIL